MVLAQRKIICTFTGSCVWRMRNYWLKLKFTYIIFFFLQNSKKEPFYTYISSNGESKILFSKIFRPIAHFVRTTQNFRMHIMRILKLHLPFLCVHLKKKNKQTTKQNNDSTCVSIFRSLAIYRLIYKLFVLCLSFWFILNNLLYMKN